MKLKSVLTFLYLAVSIPLFLFFKAEIVVWISFFVNLLLITGITHYHLNMEKVFSPFLTSFIVFVYLFFIVAPIIQISSIKSNYATFPTNYPYNTADIIYANILILIFILIFFIGYVFFKGKQKDYLNNMHSSRSATFSTPLTILSILILCLIIFGLHYSYTIQDITQSIYAAKEEAVSSLLIKRKVLFIIPLGGVIIAHRYLKEKKKITTNTIVAFLALIVLMCILLFFKNPLAEKRNALGPIYITLIYLFKPSLLNSNSKFFLFMFLSMVVAFPVLSTLTHIDASLREMVVEPKLIYESFVRFGGISNAFSSLHYDAFANIMATVDYVSINGLSYGYQLLSSLLFFVPRSLWTSKPTSTGELVGNYLIEKYEFDYNNLSNPIVSEGFIDFGFFGLFFMAIILAYYVIKLMSWLQSPDPLKKFIAFYFAIHLIFLLRGDLTSGFSYYIGTLLGVYTIPKLVGRLSRVITKTKIKA